MRTTLPRNEPTSWLTLSLLGLHGPLGSLRVSDTILFGDVKRLVAQHCGWHPHEVKLVRNVTLLEPIFGEHDATPFWELLRETYTNSVTLTVIRHRFCSRGGSDVIHRYAAGLVAGALVPSEQAPPQAVCRSSTETLQLLDILIKAALKATSRSHRGILVDRLCALCVHLAHGHSNDEATAEDVIDLQEAEVAANCRNKEHEDGHVILTPSALRKQVMQICEGMFDNMLAGATLGPSPNCIDMMELLALFFVRRFMSMRILETMVDDLTVHAPQPLFEEIQKHADGFCGILDEVTEPRYETRVARLRMQLCHPRPKNLI